MMNPGILRPATRFAASPGGLLGRPTPIPMPASHWHPEALDWQDRVRRNGGSVNGNTLSAVSQFCNAIDQAGIRNLFVRLSLMCGENLQSCLVPVYVSSSFRGTTIGNTTDANFNFVSADYQETGLNGGLQGNGVNKYLNTGVATNSFASGTSNHMSMSGTGLATSGDRIFMGSFNNAGGNGLFALDEWANYAGAGGRAFRSGTYTSGQFPFTKSVTTEELHLLGSRTSGTDCALYRNGVSVATNSSSLSVLSLAIPIWVFGLNVNNAAITSGASAVRCRSYSIGTGLNATQAAAFASAVVAFNASLGR